MLDDKHLAGMLMTIAVMLNDRSLMIMLIDEFDSHAVGSLSHAWWHEFHSHAENKNSHAQ